VANYSFYTVSVISERLNFSFYTVLQEKILYLYTVLAQFQFDIRQNTFKNSKFDLFGILYMPLGNPDTVLFCGV